MLKQKYFLTGIFILSAERQPIKLAWRKIVWLLFFLEQESVQKKGTQFIFRYAFYSVEKPRKITKQHLLKEYAGVPLEKGAYNRNKYPI